MITSGHKTVPTDLQKNPKESLHNLPKITFQKSDTSLSNKSPAFSVRLILFAKCALFHPAHRHFIDKLVE